MTFLQKIINILHILACSFSILCNFRSHYLMLCIYLTLAPKGGLNAFKIGHSTINYDTLHMPKLSFTNNDIKVITKSDLFRSREEPIVLFIYIIRRPDYVLYIIHYICLPVSQLLLNHCNQSLVHGLSIFYAASGVILVWVYCDTAIVNCGDSLFQAVAKPVFG